MYISNFTLTIFHVSLLLLTSKQHCFYRSFSIVMIHVSIVQIFSLFYICIALFKYFIYLFFFHWEIFSKIIFERHINFSGKCNFSFFFFSPKSGLEKCPRVYKICNKINITKPPLFVFIYIYIIFISIEVFHPFLNHV